MFIRITACWLADPLSGLLHQGLRTFHRFHARLGCYRLERKLPGGFMLSHWSSAPFHGALRHALRFIRLPASLYGKPAGQVIAPAEQALCDFAWPNLRDGIDPQSLVTFQNLDNLSRRRLNKALRRYPEKVRTTVARIIGTAAGTDSRR